jgi:AcrR family transcriptional regulator
MQGEKLSRREREKLRQRQEMLAAALELFSEKGYYNVSMCEIAKKSEFAVGTLYKFFQNKEDLYKSLILEQSDRFHETLMKAVEEADDEIEKLRNYVKAKSTVFTNNISFLRLYFAETRGASFNIRAGLDSELWERYGRFLHTLASVFESGMKRKRFQKIAEPYHLAVALDSLCNAFLFPWLESPERHPYPEDPDVILNIFFKGLVDP